jgi:hypothetical protein
MGGKPGAFARPVFAPARSRNMSMKRDDHNDRKDRKDRWEEQIEAAYLRLQAGLPPEPWLPNLPTLTGLRRQVRLARAGVIRPGNPRIPVRAWADTLEQGIVMNMLEREEVRKQIEEEKRQEAEYQQRSDCPRPPTRTATSPRSSCR